MTGHDLATYYRLRTQEYDQIYSKPERQEDLADLAARLRESVAGRQVLELAAGTGYWTPVIARVAMSVVATDINSETLDVARSRDYSGAEVAFMAADAFQPEVVDGEFDCIVAGFFLSHVERRSVDAFLGSLRARSPAAGRVVLFDNEFVEGSNHPITRTSESGDTYQTRRLESGETFEVLKNFYDTDELESLAAAHSSECRIVSLRYYWIMQIDFRQR